jgi:hypothetical protein
MDNQEPPVYRAAYELTIDVCRYVKDCDKSYQGTIGLLLQKEVMNMELALYHANDAENKIASIQRALDSCYAVRMIIRLLLDLGVMKLETSISINLKIEEVARQMGGWKKSLVGDLNK